MPELFLPLARGSLLWESARFCLYAQRRDVPSGLPWGQSESAFFSLDASLSYRYKAHGCASLALQRGMAADTVCAPLRGLSRPRRLAERRRALPQALRRARPGGKYGLWEAVDFTPRRCASASGESVRTVMAHHLGHEPHRRGELPARQYHVPPLHVRAGHGRLRAAARRALARGRGDAPPPRLRPAAAPAREARRRARRELPLRQDERAAASIRSRTAYTACS